MPEFAPFEIENETAGSIRYRGHGGAAKASRRPTAAKQVPAFTAITPDITLAPTTLDNTYISDFAEAAQDAVGGALTDGTTIDFTYNDGAGTITAEVKASSISNTYLSLTWSTWTPTVTQSGTVSTFTTLTARYIQIGKKVTATVYLVVNNAGTVAGANAITVSLPVNTSNVNQFQVIGCGHIFDNSAGLRYPALITQNSASTVNFRSTQTHANSTLGADDFTAALATNDIISFTIDYEVA